VSSSLSTTYVGSVRALHTIISRLIDAIVF
jgi:hypothetical protein